jgi:RimJ/RimL family protein N-acetyltransferase
MGPLGQDLAMVTSGSLPARIRPATVADADRLVELLWAVAAEGRWVGTEVPFDRDVRRARLLTGRTGAAFVADAAGAGQEPDVVGDITVVVAAYGVADIGMLLGVDWRGKGLGGALLDAALDWATHAGAHKAALEVWPHNEAGIALYRSRGFVEEGRKVRHYRRANGEIWDGILMGLQLPSGPGRTS